MKGNLFNFIKTKITELTDTEMDTILLSSSLEDIGLVSLDYISLQMAIKKEFGIAINLSGLKEKEILTVEDFIEYVLVSA